MDILGFLDDTVGKFLLVVVEFACKILPESPFLGYMDYFSSSDYLKYINYFIPIDMIIAIMDTWLLCVTLWYVYCFIWKICMMISAYNGS